MDIMKIILFSLLVGLVAVIGLFALDFVETAPLVFAILLIVCTGFLSFCAWVYWKIHPESCISIEERLDHVFKRTFFSVTSVLCGIATVAVWCVVIFIPI